MANPVLTDFTSETTSGVLLIGPSGRGVLQIKGTFVGTVDLQADIGDGWGDTGDSFSTTKVHRIELGTSGKVRLNCSSYTSGTIETVLKA